MQEMFATIQFRIFCLLKFKDNVILPIILYRYGTWCLPLWEKHRWRVYEYRVWRRIFEPKREEVAGEDCTMRSFVTFMLHQILLGLSN